MGTQTIITIGREFGSGGRVIGEQLAKELNIPFYDKELLDRAAQDSGLCKELFENHDEKPTNSFLYSLVMDTYSFGYSNTTQLSDMPLNHKVFLAQLDAIKKIAKEGPCVIVGRCADYALEEYENCLRVFIHGDTEDKIHRIEKLYDLSYNKAKDLMQKTDKKRISYYNYYSNKKWGEAQTYDLSLNSSQYQISGCVAIIKEAIRAKETQSK